MGAEVRQPVLVMRTGAGQVNAGAPGGSLPGWLSGNPASLAISAVATVIFDLGPNWQQYGLLQLALRGSQAVASVAASSSDDGSTAAAPLMAASGVGAISLALSASGTAQATALPSGRYVHVVITNGGAAQDANANLRLTAYPS